MKSLTLVAAALLVALTIAAEFTVSQDDLKGIGATCAAGDDKTCTDVNPKNCCAYNEATKAYTCQNLEIMEFAYDLA